MKIKVELNESDIGEIVADWLLRKGYKGIAQIAIVCSKADPRDPRERDYHRIVAEVEQHAQEEGERTGAAEAVVQQARAAKSSFQMSEVEVDAGKIVSALEGVAADLEYMARYPSTWNERNMARLATILRNEIEARTKG